MADLFNDLEIAEVIKETPNAVSVSFKIDDKLKADYAFKPGQYLTIKSVVNGEEIRRAYSLCSSSLGDELHTVAVKRVDGGRMSNHINDNFKVGERVSVMKPMGNFYVDLNEANNKHYFLVAGGSGITPMLSIIKSVLSKEANSKVTLVYANRDEENIIFNNTLSQLEASNSERLSVIHTLSNASSSWTGQVGRLTSERLLSIVNSNADLSNTHFYTCGPEQLMQLTVATLESNGVSSDKINVEYFTPKSESSSESTGDTSDLSNDAGISIVGETNEKIIDRQVVIINEDMEQEVTVSSSSNILEAAIDNDLDPPYACQAGVCTTCRAKLHSGKVVMDEMEGLSDEEIADGYILTCQCHPLSDDVKVEFSM